MRSHFRSYFPCAIILFGIALTMTRCTRQPPEPFRSAAVIKAMHDNHFLAHDVTDYLITDHEGVDQLAERLTKNPAAARQLMDAMIRKGGLKKVFAERCGAALPQPRIAPESQEHPIGGSQ